uniref:Secreted protein n=1 Tax=Rhipicephalus appendiculatus TaxID=34631 RepID=A0A131YGH4_RHIAP
MRLTPQSILFVLGLYSLRITLEQAPLCVLASKPGRKVNSKGQVPPQRPSPPRHGSPLRGQVNSKLQVGSQLATPTRHRPPFPMPYTGRRK